MLNLKTGSDEIFHQNLGLSSLVQCLSKRCKELLLHYLPVTQRKLAEGWDGVLTAGLRICALNNNGTPLGQKVLLQHARCISSPSLSTFISCRSSSGGIWKLRSLLLYKCNLFYTCTEYTLFPLDSLSNCFFQLCRSKYAIRNYSKTWGLQLPISSWLLMSFLNRRTKPIWFLHFQNIFVSLEGNVTPEMAEVGDVLNRPVEVGT